MFTVQLQRNLEEQGITHVHVNAVHPGVISTNILSAAGMNWMNPLLSLVRSDVETGAMTQLYCATHPNIVLKELKGLYFVPIGKVGKMSDAVTDFEGVEKYVCYVTNHS